MRCVICDLEIIPGENVVWLNDAPAHSPLCPRLELEDYDGAIEYSDQSRLVRGARA
jgi:hypothetical protein